MALRELGLVQRIKFSIMKKLTQASAISQETAVTPEEAGLTLSERGWLLYFTGERVSKIRKTTDARYYLRDAYY